MLSFTYQDSHKVTTKKVYFFEKCIVFLFFFFVSIQFYAIPSQKAFQQIQCKYGGPKLTINILFFIMQLFVLHKLGGSLPQSTYTHQYEEDNNTIGIKKSLTLVLSNMNHLPTPWVSHWYSMQMPVTVYIWSWKRRIITAAQLAVQTWLFVCHWDLSVCSVGSLPQQFKNWSSWPFYKVCMAVYIVQNSFS